MTPRSDLTTTLSGVGVLQGQIPETWSTTPVPAHRRWHTVAGVDLSLTKTGVAVHQRGAAFPELLRRIDTDPKDWRTGPDEVLKGGKVQPSTTWMDRERRLSHIVAAVTSSIRPGALVFVEAPAYGSAGSGTFDRSGLWWRVFHALTGNGCRVVPVSPSQRALYATGKGGGKDAGKDAVIAAVTRRYPWLEVTDNNVADALVLLAMARRAAGDPMELAGTIPAANLKALDKLEKI